MAASVDHQGKADAGSDLRTWARFRRLYKRGAATRMYAKKDIPDAVTNTGGARPPPMRADQCRMLN